MQLISCTYASHATAILDILNEAIVHSTALYDYKPRTPESMVSWFKTKEMGQFPIIGAVNVSDGEFLGFASYGGFRDWPAYKYSVEHSVYVHKSHRGKGVGFVLMQQIIAKAREQQYHLMVGGIDMTNQTSIALHERLGFIHAGTIKHAGFKFGRWLDLGFYQLLLETPTHPIDG